MEWLRDQVHGDVGIVSSSGRKGKQAAVSKEAKQSDGVTMSKRKKMGGGGSAPSLCSLFKKGGLASY